MSSHLPCIKLLDICIWMHLYLHQFWCRKSNVITFVFVITLVTSLGVDSMQRQTLFLFPKLSLWKFSNIKTLTDPFLQIVVISDAKNWLFQRLSRIFWCWIIFLVLVQDLHTCCYNCTLYSTTEDYLASFYTALWAVYIPLKVSVIAAIQS